MHFATSRVDRGGEGNIFAAHTVVASDGVSETRLGAPHVSRKEMGMAVLVSRREPIRAIRNKLDFFIALPFLVTHRQLHGAHTRNEPCRTDRSASALRGASP